MKNKEVAQILDEIATLLEIKGENKYKIAAYQEAARRIENLPEDIEKLFKQGKLYQIKGIGESIGQKIKEYLTTGKVTYLEELRREIPPEILELLKIPGIGPKLAYRLYTELGIKDIDSLEKAAREGKIRLLPRLGPKVEQNILEAIKEYREKQNVPERIPLGVALPLTEEIVNYLSQYPFIENIVPAGSLRRRKETIGDIDILITTSDMDKVNQVLKNLPILRNILAAGTTKTSIIVEPGIQVDFRVVDKSSFGAALQYFTGSKQHNIKLRELAIKKGLKINEYGVFRISDNKKIGGEKEEEVYEILGLQYIPPELREDQGEIEAAMEGKLPELIEEKDILGDMHVHTDWSDGANTLEEMVETAYRLGYKYVVISDHSQALGVAGGLTPEQIEKQRLRIQELNKKYRDFKILHSIEANILSDGDIDLPEEVLKKFDLVIAGLHSGFKQPKEKITERLISAIKNPWVDIISHPTGRLINKRPAYEVDLPAILYWAKETGTVLEINAQPDRLDLCDIDAKIAREKYGIYLSIGTDSHDIRSYSLIKYGIAVARRAWLKKEDVINTYSWEEAKTKLKRYKNQK
ncbi:MAG: DNA polymerase/3'-5' exonuclease PolX [Dictyoglomus thermophilum]|uniref:DNA polymerase beta n=1 Tax=Dictyoglomus thermophilum TaxID=14 RepID=A0A7V4DXT8_DICTH|nr:DNA polymerase/3'-5' exonuclease PolX [Dictyoglomus thermophilum]MCX7720358.1 DNA polymerase/3'-5' exonuclease PolX [Dictyoglomus thermophilum]TYT24500.1 DNA polymerase/3'-5' exonuclease PolX [Dictyoglomus thermophilum]